MSEEKDDYDFLTHEQWEKVCALLRRDMIGPESPLSFCAPSYPQAGQEMSLEISVAQPGMIWVNDIQKDLSAWILRDPCNSDNGDELRRCIISLENTINVLKAAYAESFGQNGSTSTVLDIWASTPRRKE